MPKLLIICANFECCNVEIKPTYNLSSYVALTCLKAVVASDMHFSCFSKRWDSDSKFHCFDLNIAALNPLSDNVSYEGNYTNNLVYSPHFHRRMERWHTVIFFAKSASKSGVFWVILLTDYRRVNRGVFFFLIVFVSCQHCSARWKENLLVVPGLPFSVCIFGVAWVVSVVCPFIVWCMLI